MKFIFSILATVLFISGLTAQNLYFPPTNSENWETISPQTLNWNNDSIESLYNYLQDSNTKAFILLIDGKIVLEKYFGTFTKDSAWYWASAGKALTSFMVGIAKQEGFLSLNDKTSKYLGSGWTSCTPQQEDKITIRHQLTMTTGLDDGVPDNFCTIDSCLIYKADAGTRWAYHNAPYTLLDKVIENATGKSLNLYVTQKLKNSTGMTGIFLPVESNNVYFSTARSMARFGLLMLNKGNWNGTQILTDSTYFNEMLNTSQNINKSYGYLWWLNGKESFMLPQLQLVFPGSLVPNAPNDMYAALGKNGQIINVVPSRNLVLIRMGNMPDNALISVPLNDAIWQKINTLKPVVTSEKQMKISENNDEKIRVYPNPADSDCSIHYPNQKFDISISNNTGIILFQQNNCFDKTTVNLQSFAQGVYFIRITNENGSYSNKKLIIN